MISDSDARAVLTMFLQTLPKCGRWYDETGKLVDRCPEVATFECYDEAADPTYRCDAHKFTGGMLEDSPPGLLRWAEAIERAKALLATAPVDQDAKINEAIAALESTRFDPSGTKWAQTQAGLNHYAIMTALTALRCTRGT